MKKKETKHEKLLRKKAEGNLPKEEVENEPI